MQGIRWRGRVPDAWWPEALGWVADSQSLSPGEQAFVNARAPKVKAAADKMMASLGLPIPPRGPIIGTAISGGGYRSMTCVVSYRLFTILAEAAGLDWACCRV